MPNNCNLCFGLGMKFNIYRFFNAEAREDFIRDRLRVAVNKPSC